MLFDSEICECGLLCGVDKLVRKENELTTPQGKGGSHTTTREPPANGNPGRATGGTGAKPVLRFRRLEQQQQTTTINGKPRSNPGTRLRNQS